MNPRTCCVCRERPATLFGGWFCGPCYRREPIHVLAACRADCLRGTPNAEQAKDRPAPAWWRGETPHR